MATERKKHDRDYYLRNRQAVMARNELQRQKIRDAIREAKDGKCCTLCSEDDPRCLVFHHIDPETKLFNVADGSRRGLRVTLQEIEKCVLWCANCHAKHHASEAY